MRGATTVEAGQNVLFNISIHAPLAGCDLTDTIKNIDKIMKLEDESGYSRAGGWETRGTYGYPYDERGSSYMRRGEHYVRGHYSRDDARQHMITELQDMLRTADGQYREVIQRALDEIRHD